MTTVPSHLNLKLCPECRVRGCRVTSDRCQSCRAKRAWTTRRVHLANMPQLPAESEEQFQNAIVELARRCGWLVYHTHDSRRSEAGFPDLVMLKDGQLIVAECKSERGYLTRAQAQWLLAFQHVQGITVEVWKPKDKQRIADILTGARTA